jgi:hypothetical protein
MEGKRSYLLGMQATFPLYNSLAEPRCRYSTWRHPLFPIGPGAPLAANRPTQRRGSWAGSGCGARGGKLEHGGGLQLGMRTRAAARLAPAMAG